MAVHRDKRNFTFNAVAGLRQPPAATGLDPFTGSIRRMEIALPQVDLPPRLMAIALARSASERAPNFPDSEPVEFGLPQGIRTTSADTVVVHLQQLHRGIPVFQSGRTVALRARRGLSVITGATVEALRQPETEVRLDGPAAVATAARFLADGGGEAGEDRGLRGTRKVRAIVLPDDFRPIQTAAFNLPAQPTIYSAEPFEGPVRASLVYLYMGPDVRLTWQVELVYPDTAAHYAVLVAAGQNEPGEVLYAVDRAHNLRGEYPIHAHNPGDGAGPISTSFPLPAGTLPTTLKPAPATRDWIDAEPVTGGNNVVCKIAGATGPVEGEIKGGVARFGPFVEGFLEDMVMHAFYYCNVMHDFFEALGFDEQSGNFQLFNYSGAPGGGNPVNAAVFDQAVDGQASMTTRADGRSPVMEMGWVSESGRHTARDSEVVFHEFTHCVTDRLVGAPRNLDALSPDQSDGMSEGWSDFFALTFHNMACDDDKVILGDWVAKDPRGFRSAPYDDDFPAGFDTVGTSRTEMHDVGEVWCATLMMAVRDLTTILDDKARAHAIAWQCVVDGLILLRGSPSFLDARDGIIDAIDDLEDKGLITEHERKATRRAFWKAFAHFKMGTGASSPDAGFKGIAGDSALPAAVVKDIREANIAAQRGLVDDLTTRSRDALASARWARLKRLREWRRAGQTWEAIEELLRSDDVLRGYEQRRDEAQRALDEATRQLEEMMREPPPA